MDEAITYLVLVDDSPESRVAMRFAALRAGHVGGQVALASLVSVAGFQQFGAVQSAMIGQARSEAEALLEGLAAECEALAGVRPETLVLEGEPGAVLAHVKANPGIRALVLGASARGAPGGMIGYFGGERAGSLPCILMLVPGGLDDERLASLA